MFNEWDWFGLILAAVALIAGTHSVTQPVEWKKSQTNFACVDPDTGRFNLTKDNVTFLIDDCDGKTLKYKSKQ